MQVATIGRTHKGNPFSLAYTFLENDVPVDLTTAKSCHLHYRSPRAAVESVVAQFVNPRTSGQVIYPDFVSTDYDQHYFQFDYVDADDNVIKGEVALVYVQRNVEDF